MSSSVTNVHDIETIELRYDGKDSISGIMYVNGQYMELRNLHPAFDPVAVDETVHYARDWSVEAWITCHVGLDHAILQVPGAAAMFNYITRALDELNEIRFGDIRMEWELLYCGDFDESGKKPKQDFIFEKTFCAVWRFVAANV